MTGVTDVAPLLLAVAAAGFADVVGAVEAGAARVEQEAEGLTAADTALFIKPVLLHQQRTPTALLLQLLLQITTDRERGGGGRDRARERERRRDE